MATKLRRSLYIGLGGTGIKTILQTKKMFIDTYGEVPPMIGFLGIDTDRDEFTQRLKAANGEDVSLSPDEIIPLCVENARVICEGSRERLSWIPEQNRGYIPTHINMGASQVRTNGRFALTVNRDKVMTAIQCKLNDIQYARITNNPYYDLLPTAAPEIHMVFSVCGGTGAGTFINMAYLLRDVAPQSRLYGYAVLPEVFRMMSPVGMPRIAPNAYASLVDLDYLMHRSMNDTPLTIEYLQENKHSVVRGRPFNSVVFIDNKNENNDTYTDVNQLTEMISLALITSSGSLSIAGAAVGDNLEKNISEGSMNVENKVAWAGGMGACEIVYRGEALSNIYRMKAAQRVINSLLSTDTDADAIANAWIDSAEVKIRENNGRDDVTNFIADKSPKYGFSVSDKKNPRPDVDQNIESNKIKTDEIDKKVDALLTRVHGELRNLIVKNINGEGGVALAKRIIAVLEAQVKLCLGEMKAEKDELNGKLPTFSSKIDVLINDIKEAAKSIFTRGRVREIVEELEQVVKDYNTVLRDIQRHDAAITIYNSVLVLIKESAEKVECIEQLLEGVKANLTRKIAALQAGAANDNGIFQINLAAEDAKRIVVDTKEIVVSDFVNTLGGESKIYGLGEYSVSEVENFFMEYTKVLNGANAYANKGVEEALREILSNGEEGEQEFKKIIRRAIGKSMPLFRYNYVGFFPTENPDDNFYVGVCDAANSILAEDDKFKNVVPGNNNISFVSTGMRDRIIVYHQVGVVPVYAINGIRRYRAEYEQSNRNCHFDANILRKMRREYFDINPTIATEVDMLDMWIRLLNEGYIKHENDCYYLRSAILGEESDDYWVRLAEWRDEAFEVFKRYERVVADEYAHLIN